MVQNRPYNATDEWWWCAADLGSVRVSVQLGRQSAGRGPVVWHSGRLCQAEEQDRLAQRRQPCLERPVHVPGYTTLSLSLSLG